MVTKNIKKIAGYRAMLGLTQKELSKLLGITPQSYSSKENGIRAFNDSEKIILKNFFLTYFPDLTIDSLFF